MLLTKWPTHLSINFNVQRLLFLLWHYFFKLLHAILTTTISSGLGYKNYTPHFCFSLVFPVIQIFSYLEAIIFYELQDEHIGVWHGPEVDMHLRQLTEYWQKRVPFNLMYCYSIVVFQIWFLLLSFSENILITYFLPLNSLSIPSVQCKWLDNTFETWHL